MRFEEIYARYGQRQLSARAAAEWLGASERTFRRWRGRYDKGGGEGLLDGRLGKPGANRIGVAEVARVAELCGARYQGWTTQHFHEPPSGFQRSRE